MAFTITKLSSAANILKYGIVWSGAPAPEATLISNATLLADASEGPLQAKLATAVANNSEAAALVFAADMNLQIDQVGAAPGGSLSVVTAAPTATAGALTFGIFGNGAGSSWSGVLTIEFRHTIIR